MFCYFLFCVMYDFSFYFRKLYIYIFLNHLFTFSHLWLDALWLDSLFSHKNWPPSSSSSSSWFSSSSESQWPSAPTQVQWLRHDQNQMWLGERYVAGNWIAWCNCMTKEMAGKVWRHYFQEMTKELADDAARLLRMDWIACCSSTSQWQTRFDSQLATVFATMWLKDPICSWKRSMFAFSIHFVKSWR